MSNHVTTAELAADPQRITLDHGAIIYHHGGCYYHPMDVPFPGDHFVAHNGGDGWLFIGSPGWHATAEARTVYQRLAELLPREAWPQYHHEYIHVKDWKRLIEVVEKITCPFPD